MGKQAAGGLAELAGDCGTAYEGWGTAKAAAGCAHANALGSHVSGHQQAVRLQLLLDCAQRVRQDKDVEL